MCSVKLSWLTWYWWRFHLGLIRWNNTWLLAVYIQIKYSLFYQKWMRSTPFRAENQTSAVSEQTLQQPDGKPQTLFNLSPIHRAKTHFLNVWLVVVPVRRETICLQAASPTVNIFTLIPREETSILQVCEIDEPKGSL